MPHPLPVPARFATLLVPLLGACAPAPPRQQMAPPAPAEPVLAAMALVDHAATAALWPGFDPRSVPVAVFDGARTLLFRHPDPPAGFATLEGAGEAMVHPGRHPAVQANSTASLNGVTTATVVWNDSTRAPQDLARLVVHEAFHAFREARHPGWVGNEVELFVYPVADPELLRLRRLETEALRRALDEAERSRVVCWAGVALALRAERFASLSTGAAAYERGTELNEGLARYVERRVGGDPGAGVLPSHGFPAAAVRERSYATGHALALLLDRLEPGWKEALARDDSASLDGRLRAALQGAPSADCGLTEAGVRQAAAQAGRDVAEYRRAQAERRREFVAAGGWTLEVLTDAEPLWPQGFDPLNVHRLSEGEVLHSRWLKLGNSSGTVEVLGRASLSEAAGSHPLFNGVRRLMVTGLPQEPLVRDSAGVVTVDADGVAARFGGSVLRGDRRLTLRVGGA